MNDEMKQDMESFVKLCYSRLEKGDKERRESFMKLDLYREMTEELADVANYAFLQYVKIKRMMKKMEEFSE